MKRLALILAMAAGTAQAADLPTSFDLNCAGRETMREQGDRPLPKVTSIRPFALSLRIDLVANRFCSGACLETRPLMRVTPTIITLEMFSNAGAATDFISEVKRESGAYISISRFRLQSGQTWGRGSAGLTQEGLCQRAPFSGFPPLKF
jgi:hypothetical protein